MKKYNPHNHSSYDVTIIDCEVCEWGKLYQRCRSCKELACDGYCMEDGPRCCECWEIANEI